MSISDACKKRWCEQIQEDYPNLPIDMISTLLDVYQSDKTFIDDKIKELKKKHKGPLEIKNKLSLEEMEKLYEIGLKNQEEIKKSFSGGVIPADDNTIVEEEKI